MHQRNLESDLQKYFKQVLEAETIGLHDDFFTLGGDSIKAMRLIALIQSKYKISLPPDFIFDYGTVSSISQALIKNYIYQPRASIENSSVKRLNRKGGPILPTQEALLKTYLSTGSLKQFNVVRKFKIVGPLECSILQKSYNQVLDLNDTLRTYFSSQNGKYVQHVSNKFPHLEYYAVQDDENPNLFVKKKSYEVFNTEFEINKGQLIRFVLIKIKPNQHILLLAASHLILDGWSVMILLKQISSLYNDFTKEQRFEKRDKGFQPTDFSYWRSQYLKDHKIKNQQSFWSKRLSKKPIELLSFSLQPYKKTMSANKGAKVYLRIDAKLTQKINIYCIDNNITAFILFQSIFHILLQYYSDAEHTVTCSPIAYRQYKNTDKIMGMFVNILPFNMIFNKETRIKDVIENFRELLTQVRDNQDVGLNSILKSSKLKAAVLQQYMVIMRENEESSLSLRNTKVVKFKANTGTARTDMTLWIEKKKQTFELAIEYSTNNYTKEFVKKLTDHLKTLVKMTLTEADTLVSKIELFPYALSEGKVRTLQGERLENFFTSQLQLNPSKIIIEAGGCTYTYKEIDLISEKFKNFIVNFYKLKKNKDPDVVCIIVERSYMLTAIILGVLKAGYPFYIIDPKLPIDRINDNLTVLNTSLCLYETSFSCLNLTKKVSSKSIDRILDKDQNSFLISSNLEYESDRKSNVACVFFTSGSTGKPKSVYLTHQNILNRLQWEWENFPLGSEEKVCQRTSVNFIDYITESLSPLLKSVTQVIFDDEIITNLKKFPQGLKSTGITKLLITPSLLETLMEVIKSSDLRDLSKLKKVFVSGEPLSSYTAKRFFKCFKKGTRLINLYGSTEVTGDVTYYELKSHLSGNLSIAPLGKSINNTQVFITGERDQKLPLNTIGQITVSGLNITVEDPQSFSNEDCQKFFKTGDIGYIDESGLVHTLGRKDNQLKIRGIRINPLEISNCLETQEKVSKALTLVVEGPTKNQDLLVSYVVLKQKNNLKTLDEGEVKRTLLEWLKRKLPEYMLPNKVVMLGSFKKTSTGKVDIKKIREIEQFETEGRHSKSLFSIWKELLNVKSVSNDSDFFDLGGNSLLLMKLRVLLQNKFACEVSNVELYDSLIFNKMLALISHKTKNR